MESNSTKTIEVKEYITVKGKEYDFASYPGPGFYYNRDTSSLYFAGANLCIMCITGVQPFHLKDAAAEFATATSTTSANFGEDFVLRAIAIAQAPQLATQLLGVRPA